MLPLLIALTKLNLEFERQKKQSNMILISMGMNDLTQVACLMMKRCEPLLQPVMRVFSNSLAKEMGSMLFLGSSLSALGNHCSLHDACVFACALHSQNCASCDITMQLLLVRLVFIAGTARIYFSCPFQLVYISSHCWTSLLPFIDCFLLNKTSLSSVLILSLIMCLSNSIWRQIKNIYFGRDQNFLPH